MSTVDILQMIAPTGLVAAGVMVFQAVRTWKEMRAKEDDNLLNRWRDEITRTQNENEHLRRDLDFSEREGDWWRNRAGDLEHALRSAGVDVPVASTPRPRRGDEHATG